MAPALHFLHEAGGTRTKTEATTRSPKRTVAAYAAAAPLRREPAPENKNGVTAKVGPPRCAWSPSPVPLTLHRGGYGRRRSGILPCGAGEGDRPIARRKTGVQK